MKQIAVLVFLHLSQAYPSLEKCSIDPKSKTNEWEERFRNTLLCNYNPRTPPKPLNGSDSIVVKPSFLMNSFQLWDEDQVFSVSTWTRTTWTDDRLKWDPNNFDGIDKTAMTSYKLWVPGISLHNSINQLYGHTYAPFVPCRISKEGKVQCIYDIEFQAKCPMDLSDWPFDTHVCSLEFKSWIVPGTKIQLDVSPEAVTLIDLKNGAEWDIMDYNQEKNQDAEVQLKFSFTLMRHTTNLGAIIIIPSILLSILTFSTLFLDARSTNRVYIAGFSLMCHFYFLSELGMNIPKHSMSSPRILFYFRGSVIMTSISMIISLIMKCLCDRKEIPDSILIFNEYVYESYARLVVCPRWQFANNDTNKNAIKGWIDFISILNSVWIYITLLVYIVMCCTLIPLPSGLKQNIDSITYEF